jgi:hypothetical protein
MPGVYNSRETFEIELHSNSLNREDNFCLSTSGKPVIYSLKDNSRPSSHDSRSGFSVG